MAIARSDVGCDVIETSSLEGDACREDRGKGFDLICPKDHTMLVHGGGSLKCGICGTVYPIVGGVPILINDENSVFSVTDYVAAAGYDGAGYGREWDRARGLRRLAHRIFRYLADAPSNISHISDEEAIAQVRAVYPHPRILVVGAGGRTHGNDTDRPTYMDVALGPGIDVIADGHDIPFPDGSFDLIIAIAVLEHVADPPRCVDEFRRVLRPCGFVYAITPFLQPVHMGAYDFTRFTPLGHRRLFRWFDTIDAGAALGTGTVMAWAVSSFLESIPSGRLGRQIFGAIGLLLRPPLRRLDRWLHAPPHIDGAGGCFFFGRLRDKPVPDRIILREYRGGFPRPQI